MYEANFATLQIIYTIFRFYFSHVFELTVDTQNFYLELPSKPRFKYLFASSGAAL